MINEDYGEYVSLSSRLVNVEGFVLRMRKPLVELKVGEVCSSRNVMGINQRFSIHCSILIGFFYILYILYMMQEKLGVVQDSVKAELSSLNQVPTGCQHGFDHRHTFNNLKKT